MKKIIISLLLITTACAQQKDGTLDPLFGTNGQFEICNGITSTEVERVIIQNDNKIVVAGTSDGDFFLARVNTDGAADTTFGNNGVVVTSIAPGGSSIFALALQPDGKIIAGGASVNGVTLVRYNPNGTLDTTFGSGGIVVDNGITSEARDIAIQPDGKIIAVTAFGLALARIIRYNSDGTRDITFGTAGVVIPVVPGTDLGLNGVQLDNNGNIVVVGSASNNFAYIARFLSSGAIDTTFGNGGFNTLQVNGLTRGVDVGIQEDGNIVFLMRAASLGRIAFARYNSQGILDSAFGNAGIFIGPANTTAVRMSIQSDGKLLSVGAFRLVRVTANGDLDVSFGNNGIVGIPVFENVLNARDIAINSQGQIVVAGLVLTCSGIAQFQVNSLGYSQISQALWTRYYNQNIQQRFA